MGALRWVGFVVASALLAGAAIAQSAQDVLRQSVGPGDYVIRVEMIPPNYDPGPDIGLGCLAAATEPSTWLSLSQAYCTVFVFPVTSGQSWKLAATSASPARFPDAWPPTLYAKRAGRFFVAADDLEKAAAEMGALADAILPDVPHEKRNVLLYVSQAYSVRELVILHQAWARLGAKSVTPVLEEARTETPLKPEPFDVRSFRPLRTAFDK